MDISPIGNDVMLADIYSDKNLSQNLLSVKLPH
jgi:hypothetical protein